MNMNRSPEHVRLHADPRLFEALVEQTPDAIIFADCDGMIRVWNRGAETVFGFSAAEVIGSSLDVIIPERFRRAHWEGFHQAIERGHTQHGGQVRTTRSIHKLGHTLYEQHIEREERDLPPMAARLLSDDALERIGRAMRERRGVEPAV